MRSIDEIESELAFISGIDAFNQAGLSAPAAGPSLIAQSAAKRKVDLERELAQARHLEAAGDTREQGSPKCN